MTWKLLNLSLFDNGVSKQYLFYLSFMGWPFQLKILFSFIANPDELTFKQLLSKIRRQAFVHFILIQILSVLITKQVPWFYLFCVGSLLNMNACMSTILFFKTSTLIAQYISSKTIATVHKSGRKISASFLSAFLISIASRWDWQCSYQTCSYFFLLFGIFCQFMSWSQYPLFHNNEEKNNKTKNLKFYDNIQKIKMIFHDIHLRDTLNLFLIINIGHHLLHGWTIIYLKDIGFSMSFIAGQKIISLAAYMLGITLVYLGTNKYNFSNQLLLSLSIYSISLYFLIKIDSNNLFFATSILFLKNFSSAMILSMKYAWITSLCTKRGGATLIYTSIITISNILTFIGASLGGFLMSTFSWQVLFTFALLLNIPGLIKIVMKNNFIEKKDLIYL
jgi:predicted MFS family arabinose efflux permease